MSTQFGGFGTEFNAGMVNETGAERPKKKRSRNRKKRPEAPSSDTVLQLVSPTVMMKIICDRMQKDIRSKAKMSQLLLSVSWLVKHFSMLEDYTYSSDEETYKFAVRTVKRGTFLINYYVDLIRNYLDPKRVLSLLTRSSHSEFLIGIGPNCNVYDEGKIILENSQASEKREVGDISRRTSLDCLLRAFSASDSNLINCPQEQKLLPGWLINDLLDTFSFSKTEERHAHLRPLITRWMNNPEFDVKEFRNVMYAKFQKGYNSKTQASGPEACKKFSGLALTSYTPPLAGRISAYLSELKTYHHNFNENISSDFKYISLIFGKDPISQQDYGMKMEALLNENVDVDRMTFLLDINQIPSNLIGLEPGKCLSQGDTCFNIVGYLLRCGFEVFIMVTPYNLPIIKNLGLVVVGKPKAVDLSAGVFIVEVGTRSDDEEVSFFSPDFKNKLARLVFRFQSTVMKFHLNTGSREDYESILNVYSKHTIDAVLEIPLSKDYSTKEISYVDNLHSFGDVPDFTRRYEESKPEPTEYNSNPENEKEQEREDFFEQADEKLAFYAQKEADGFYTQNDSYGYERSSSNSYDNKKKKKKFKKKILPNPAESTVIDGEKSLDSVTSSSEEELVTKDENRLVQASSNSSSASL